VGRNIFSLKIPSTISILKPKSLWNDPEKSLLQRISQGVISLLMSLRLLPQVKYIADSDACA
jgi:vacuolar protein sorting-associated protein 45